MEEQKEHQQKGKMIAIVSAKGGVGKTLLSVNLATALRKSNVNVSILDGDFQFGDVAIAMDLQPAYSIKEVIEEVEQLDSMALTNFLTMHASGVHVLPAPERPEYADLITSQHVENITKLLLEENDYLIVDTGAGIQEQTVEILERADLVLVVTNLEMTSLKNTKLILETLDVLELRRKVQLVINRYNMESLVKSEDVARMLGEKREFYIPNNYKLASQSLNLGMPLVLQQPKSDISKAILKMAEQIILTNQPEDLEKEQKRSMLQKLLPSK